MNLWRSTLCLLLGLVLTSPAMAANCNKNPTHPSCSPESPPPDSPPPPVTPSLPALVFHNVGTSRIEVADADGGNRRALPGTFGSWTYPKWSRDGEWIAFGCRGLWTMDVANNQPAADVMPAGFRGSGDCTSDWAPGNLSTTLGDAGDRGLIAFIGGPAPDGASWASVSNIYLLNPVNGKYLMLKESPHSNERSEPESTFDSAHSDMYNWGWISWSRDGSRFALGQNTRETSWADKSLSIWIVDVAIDDNGDPYISGKQKVYEVTNGQCCLTPEFEIAPTGDALIVAHGSQLWFVPDSGGPPALLDGDWGTERMPAWSPNGQEIVFGARNQKGSAIQGLFRATIDTTAMELTNPVNIVPGGTRKSDPTWADWNPQWPAPN